MPEMERPGSPGINPFDAILFDLGNTLIYFDGEWQEVLSKACLEAWRSLASSGLKLDRDTFVQEFLGKLNAYYVEREAEFIEYTTAYVLKDSWLKMDILIYRIRSCCPLSIRCILFLVTTGMWKRTPTLS
jgi:FMN phosphatase YigB (HAD superfamily)